MRKRHAKTADQWLINLKLAVKTPEIMVLGGYGADAGATTEVLDLEAGRKTERTMKELWKNHEQIIIIIQKKVAQSCVFPCGTMRLSIRFIVWISHRRVVGRLDFAVFAAVAGHDVASRANIADAKSLLCGFYASDSGRSTIGCLKCCTLTWFKMGKSMGTSMGTSSINGWCMLMQPFVFLDA